jgi:CxxC-x17-CxxC domain-containing protein
MKKCSKRGSFSISPTGKPDVAALITKIGEQLVSLEKKVDILIGRPQERPFEREHFLKAPESFSRPHHGYGKEKQGSHFKERKLYQVICADCNKECEVPFKPSADRPVYCRECFSRRNGDGTLFKRKYDHRPKEQDFTQERHIDKQQGGENRMAVGAKKPFSKHRKKRK